jgi:GTP cyclohydrolase I
VLVVLDARHGCVTARGTRQAESTTVTVASRGSLAEPTAQAGVLALVGGASAEQS